MTQRARRDKIIQAADVQHRHRQIQLRLAVGGKEFPPLGGMLINMQLHVQGPLDVGHGPFHIHQHPIGRGVLHCKTIGFQKRRHGRIIAGRWPELLGELFRRQKMAEMGACRVVQILQQLIERGLILQGQTDGQLQAIRRFQPA